MKRLLTITILVALVLTAGMALAEPTDSSGDTYAPWCWRNDITMTDDQNQRLSDIQEKYWEKFEAVMDSIADKQDELDNIYRNDNPDYTKADALEDEIFDLRRELIELRRSYRDEARSVLTDEQLSEYPDAFCAGCGMGSGRGNGMGYGMGYGKGHGGGYGMGAGRGCWR